MTLLSIQQHVCSKNFFPHTMSPRLRTALIHLIQEGFPIHSNCCGHCSLLPHATFCGPSSHQSFLPPATSSGVQRANLPASRTAKAERTCHQTLTTRPSTFSDSGHELGMVLVASPRMPSREDLAAFAAAVGMS